MNEPARIDISLSAIGNLDSEIANCEWVIDDFRAGIDLKTEAKANSAAVISNRRGDIENFRFL